MLISGIIRMSWDKQYHLRRELHIMYGSGAIYRELNTRRKVVMGE